MIKQNALSFRVMNEILNKLENRLDELMLSVYGGRDSRFVRASFGGLTVVFGKNTVETISFGRDDARTVGERERISERASVYYRAGRRCDRAAGRALAEGGTAAAGGGVGGGTSARGV